MNPYRVIQRDAWKLSVNDNYWKDSWWPHIEQCIAENKSDWRDSRHAHSKFTHLPRGDTTVAVYLKLYKKPVGIGAIKEYIREPKHQQAFRITLELKEKRFLTPTVYACGDTAQNKTYSGLLITEKLPYIDLSRLPGLLNNLPCRQRKQFKQLLLTTLGEQIGRLHNLGYVHGDLVITNILVDPGDPQSIVFIDHDRSKHGPTPTRRHLQMRNLVQANRHVIDGINNADRLRAFLAYARTRQWNTAKARSMSRKIAQRTTERRRERALR